MRAIRDELENNFKVNVVVDGRSRRALKTIVLGRDTKCNDKLMEETTRAVEKAIFKKFRRNGRRADACFRTTVLEDESPSTDSQEGKKGNKEKTPDGTITETTSAEPPAVSDEEHSIFSHKNHLSFSQS
mmetsp:Transcript_32365/g.68088  ORF Transcript_32365/g.68088 Transcript_32365/m.68088 type:complete len:129 (+) Transcript_32365:749-1135(+)